MARQYYLFKKITATALSITTAIDYTIPSNMEIQFDKLLVLPQDFNDIDNIELEITISGKPYPENVDGLDIIVSEYNPYVDFFVKVKSNDRIVAKIKNNANYDIDVFVQFVGLR